MRTERRMGQGWIWLALILLVFSVPAINATARSRLADDAAAAAAAAEAGGVQVQPGGRKRPTSGGSSRVPG